jgi:hypothetical protein
MPNAPDASVGDGASKGLSMLERLELVDTPPDDLGRIVEAESGR